MMEMWMFEAASGVALGLFAGHLGWELVGWLGERLRFDHVQHRKWETGEFWFYGDRMMELPPPRCARPIDL